MTRVHLTGMLLCRDEREAAIVAAHLAEHVASTRAEAGCLSFEVVPTSDPLVWNVEEWFVDETAFALHQDRVSASAWGRATIRIERRYSVNGA